MLRLRGMNLMTASRAAVAGCRRVPQPKFLFICIADHFEPDWQSASPMRQRERVARWVQEYGPSVAGFSDSRGRPPQHTFFYPMECYTAQLVESLAGIVRDGWGDIEVHLHHDNDQADRLREFLLKSVEYLNQRHGLLTADSAGQLRYGFIHGNWALDNSHPDGRWCGVNNELTILRETGCYADFTMPAAPHAAQTRTINSIYYAVDDPSRPKSHDYGVPAATGSQPPIDSLLMIQGPLLIRRQHARWKPRLENANIAGSQPPTAERISDWLRARVQVQGRDEWLFVKLHTHGAQEANAAVLLGPAMRHFHTALNDYARQRQIQFHYVTAREMAQLVHQAERGSLVPDFDRLGWD